MNIFNKAKLSYNGLFLDYYESTAEQFFFIYHIEENFQHKNILSLKLLLAFERWFTLQEAMEFITNNHEKYYALEAELAKTILFKIKAATEAIRNIQSNNYIVTSNYAASSPSFIYPINTSSSFEPSPPEGGPSNRNFGPQISQGDPNTFYFDNFYGDTTHRR